MDDVQRCHEGLLQQRTQIRHDHAILRWMKWCWRAAAHADPHAMTQDEYEDMYSILLYEMTICWEEELNDAVLAKIWRRDAASHASLNFDRFACSIFYFVEMWVEEISLVEYEKIFGHVYRTLSGQDQSSTTTTTTSTVSLPSDIYKPRTFKPTLESFNNALDNDKAMEELQMNFGKSIAFNAQQYFRHFGTPTTHLQAFQATLLHLQSRVHIEPTERGDTNTTRSTTAQPSTSSGNMLRRQLRQSAHRRPSSPLRSESPSPSPPRPVRPVTSPGRASFCLENDTSGHSSGHGSARTSPARGGARHGGEAFVLTGRSVLH